MKKEYFLLQWEMTDSLRTTGFEKHWASTVLIKKFVSQIWITVFVQMLAFTSDFLPGIYYKIYAHSKAFEP